MREIPIERLLFYLCAVIAAIVSLGITLEVIRLMIVTSSLRIV